MKPGDLVKTIDGRHTRPISAARRPAPAARRAGLGGEADAAARGSRSRSTSTSCASGSCRSPPQRRMLDDAPAYVKVAEFTPRAADDVRAERRGASSARARSSSCSTCAAPASASLSEGVKVAELFMKGGAVGQAGGRDGGRAGAARRSRALRRGTARWPSSSTTAPRARARSWPPRCSTPAAPPSWASTPSAARRSAQTIVLARGRPGADRGPLRLAQGHGDPRQGHRPRPSSCRTAPTRTPPKGAPPPAIRSSRRRSRSCAAARSRRRRRPRALLHLEGRLVGVVLLGHGVAAPSAARVLPRRELAQGNRADGRAGTAVSTAGRRSSPPSCRPSGSRTAEASSRTPCPWPASSGRVVDRRRQERASLRTFANT